MLLSVHAFVDDVLLEAVAAAHAGTRRVSRDFWCPAAAATDARCRASGELCVLVLPSLSLFSFPPHPSRSPFDGAVRGTAKHVFLTYYRLYCIGRRSRILLKNKAVYSISVIGMDFVIGVLFYTRKRKLINNLFKHIVKSLSLRVPILYNTYIEFRESKRPYWCWSALYGDWLGF